MSNPRPRPKAMMLTQAAAERIKAIMAAKETNVVGARIGVKKGGCAGMEYTMAWADKQEPFDEVVEDKGARVLVDPKALLSRVSKRINADHQRGKPLSSHEPRALRLL
jgi:iron-sulfur cluster assembly protein